MEMNNDVQPTKKTHVVKMDTSHAKDTDSNYVHEVAQDPTKLVIEEGKTYTMKDRIRVTLGVVAGVGVALLVSTVVILAIRKDQSSASVTTPPPDREVGEPLFLTPYITRGEYQTARNKSRTFWPDSPDTELYSGFVTVNETINSNLHFLFLPSKKNVKEDPVLLYLNGGPGDSSIHCVFICHGPVYLTQGKLKRNTLAWNEHYSVIYLDQPVGTGYSFTEHPDGYARNEKDIARDLFRFLEQFFTMFPYQRNPFYPVGESYAGKYIPAISHRIHLENLDPASKLKINLKGMFISAGYCDPEVMIAQYPNIIFYVGMFTEKERDYFKNQIDEIIHLIREKRFLEAFEINDRILLGFEDENVTYFFNQTGATVASDYRYTKAPDSSPIHEYMHSAPVRRTFHVGNRTLHDGRHVFSMMKYDLMDTVKPWIVELLDNDYKMMFVSGQFDLLVNVAMTEAFLMSTNWKGLSEYKMADKVVWKLKPDDSEPAGYVRKAKNMYQVLVRGAGHHVFQHQKERIFDLLERFINDTPFA